MNPSILIACALKQEAAGLESHLRAHAELSFLVTGLGALRTRKKLERHFQRQAPSLFLFTGTAGQLDPGLPMGRVVCPERWEMASPSVIGAADRRLLEGMQKCGFPVASLGLTVRFPVVLARERQALFEQTGAAVCDMEAAAALAAAAQFEVPAVAPKVISDTRDLGVFSFWSQLEANLKELAEYLDELLLHLPQVLLPGSSQERDTRSPRKNS